MTNLLSHQVQTYTVSSPLATHKDYWRTVTCEEVQCEAQQHGWQSFIDESTDLGKQQAWYIRNQSGRKYTEDRKHTGTTFTFAPDQRCFTEHKVRTARPELYVVRHGDERQYLGVKRRHTRPEDWVDDFQNHQQGIIDAQQKG